MVTIFVNTIVMTLFLWHMTAFLIAILILWPLGLGRGHSDARWWLERFVWIGVTAVILAGLVAGLRSFRAAARYSHSIVAGGFDVMSYATRFTPGTSATIRDAIFSSSS